MQFNKLLITSADKAEQAKKDENAIAQYVKTGTPGLRSENAVLLVEKLEESE